MAPHHCARPNFLPPLPPPFPPPLSPDDLAWSTGALAAGWVHESPPWPGARHLLHWCVLPSWQTKPLVEHWPDWNAVHNLDPLRLWLKRPFASTWCSLNLFCAGTFAAERPAACGAPA